MRMSAYLKTKGLFRQVPYETVEDRENLILFRAVLDQGLYDVILPEHPMTREEAIAWFNPADKDFAWVCKGAGFDPYWVHKKFTEVLLEMAIKNVDISAKTIDTYLIGFVNQRITK
jgi:hypothetical protein